jgi:hypothetical protein
MDNKENWGEPLEELVNDIRRDGSVDSVHIHVFVRNLLSSQLDTLEREAEKQSRESLDDSDHTLAVRYYLNKVLAKIKELR